MKSKIFAFLALLMIGTAVAKAQTIYAIWCENNKTLYFDYSDEFHAEGLKYEGQDITKVWAKTDVTIFQDAAWINEVKSSVTKVIFKPSFSSVTPTSTKQWFYNFNFLQEIEGLKYLNTSQVTDMSFMFQQCNLNISY